MTTKTEITQVYIDLSPDEVKGFVSEVETLWKAAGIPNADEAKSAYPNVHAMYSGLYNTYMVSNQGEITP